VAAMRIYKPNARLSTTKPSNCSRSPIVVANSVIVFTTWKISVNAFKQVLRTPPLTKSDNSSNSSLTEYSSPTTNSRSGTLSPPPLVGNLLDFVICVLPIAERWVRSVRQECLEHLLILSRRHLWNVLTEYTAYYNVARPHQGLEQHAPIPVQVSQKGQVRCRDV